MEGVYASVRRRGRPKRKPLYDLTNTRPLSSDPSLWKLKTKANLSEPRPTASVKSSSSIGSSDPENRGDPSIPTSAPRSKEISRSSVVNAVDHDKSKHSTLSRQPTKEVRKDKGKAVATSATLSCSQLVWTKRSGGTWRMEDGAISLPGAYSEPCKKTIKRQHHAASEDEDKDIWEHRMPQDFIEKQRAYFAEVDAFELPEEVVSESELE